MYLMFSVFANFLRHERIKCIWEACVFGRPWAKLSAAIQMRSNFYDDDDVMMTFDVVFSFRLRPIRRRAAENKHVWARWRRCFQWRWSKRKKRKTIHLFTFRISITCSPKIDLLRLQHVLIEAGSRSHFPMTHCPEKWFRFSVPINGAGFRPRVSSAWDLRRDRCAPVSNASLSKTNQRSWSIRPPTLLAA